MGAMPTGIAPRQLRLSLTPEKGGLLTHQEHDDQ